MAPTAASWMPVLPHLRSGKLRGYLEARSVAAGPPDAHKSRYQGYDASNWYAIATASGTPRPIVTKLHDEIARYFRIAEA